MVIILVLFLMVLINGIIAWYNYDSENYKMAMAQAATVGFLLASIAVNVVALIKSGAIY